MRTRLMLFLVLLLCLAYFAQAQPLPPTTCSDVDIRNYWNLRFGFWQDVCLLGILISFFTISLLYMASQVFGNQGLAAWCKKEIFQVIVTALIFGGIFGFISFTCGFFKPSFFISLDDNGDGIPDHPDDMFQYGTSYLEWLRDTSYTIYAEMAVLNSYVVKTTSTYVYQSPGGLGVNLRPLMGLSSLSGILSFSMSTLLVGGVLTTIAQLRMLRVIQLMMFNMILPIGLLARCFEPFRRFGGSMIAIAIGLFIFYPFLLMLNGGLVKNNFITDASIIQANTQVTSTTPDSLETANQRDVDARDPNYNNPDPLNSGAGYTSMSSYGNLFQALYKLGARNLIAALFLPILNFILLITFIRNLSRALGEEVDITNVTRMI